MANKQKPVILAVFFFIALTLLMTYPLAFKMGTGAKDFGDTLLNTWILSSNVRSISHLEINSFFESNIFFPHSKTLAYSEYLFTQSLFALPLSLVFHNPLFIHNALLIFAFFSSALGMFFLIRYLTQNTLASLIAGTVFGFSPFLISHFPHLQNVTAGGIPLAFLFLHKYFQKERIKHLFLFALFFILQVLANGYYAIYLSLFAGLYILLFFFTRKKYKDLKFWIRMAVLLILTAVFILPFFFQYLDVRQEMGFSRQMGAYARFSSFLSVPYFNNMYGKPFRPFLQNEGQLFPGFAVVILALIGIYFVLKKKNHKNLLFDKPIIPYLFILTLAFSFTFGPKGPYVLLFKYVPGFDGLRVASRFHIFVLFSLAVLAAYGVKELTDRIFKSGRKKYFLHIPLLCLIILEFISVPIPIKTISAKQDIPKIYQWLAEKKNIQNIIELPLPSPKEAIPPLECPRIYYSTYHRKNMVNGYSGYFPPLYDELRKRWQSNTLTQNIKDLRILGVDHILFHSHLYYEQEWEKIVIDLLSHRTDLDPVTEIEGTYVFQIRSDQQEASSLEILPETLPVASSNWEVTASINTDDAFRAIDGNIQTRWESGPQREGISFQLDLGRPSSVQGISLKLGDKPNDFPRSFLVELSMDGKLWQIVHEEEMTILPITAYLKPRKMALDISFPMTESRYIRIVNTGNDKITYWSIFEIEVFN